MPKISSEKMCRGQESKTSEKDIPGSQKRSRGTELCCLITCAGTLMHCSKGIILMQGAELEFAGAEEGKGYNKVKERSFYRFTMILKEEQGGPL